MSMEELKTAVTRLSKAEFTHFRKWFETFMEEQRDRKAVLKAKARIAAGEPTTPWAQVKKEIGLE